MFLAFPVHGVLWPQAMATAMALLSRGGTFAMKGSPWLDSVRAELVGQFLDSKETEFFTQDADNWFDAEIVERMRQSQADIITASYRKREPPHEFVVRTLAGGPLSDAPMRRLSGGSRVIEIEGDGLGSCFIRRHVLEQLTARHPELSYVSPEGRARCNLFEYGIYSDRDGIRRSGQEDRAFFDRVRAAGFRIECLIDATVIHGGVPGRLGEELSTSP